MSQFAIYTFAENSATVTNHGSGGSGYNGQANRNMYAVRNGHGTYGPFGAADHIIVPAGAANNNQLIHSWELAFYVVGNGADATYAHLWDKAYGGYMLEMQKFGGYYRFTLYRAIAGGGGCFWSWMTGSFNIGEVYYLQVAANMPANPQSASLGNVHCHIGWGNNAPVHWSDSSKMEFGRSGAGTSWFNDSGQTVMIGNSPANNYNANVYFWIIREYDQIINWDNSGNWATDHLLWNPNQATTISCNASTLTPILGANYVVSGTLQTTGGTKLAYKPLTVFYSLDNGGTWQWTGDGWTNTDANGNYSYAQTAVATEWEYVEYYGGTGYNSCISPVIKVYGQKIPTSLSLATSNANPPLGATFTLSGTLRANGVAFANQSIDLWVASMQSGPWTHTVGAATTDSSGNYSKNITAIAGTMYYGVSFIEIGNYAGCSSSPLTVPIATITNVDVTINATTITSESGVKSPTEFIAVDGTVNLNDIGTDHHHEHASVDASVLDIIPQIDCTIVSGCVYSNASREDFFAPVVEADADTVWLDIEGMYEVVIPFGPIVEAEALNMPVAQLSTEVHAAVIESIAATAPFCPTHISQVLNLTTIEAGESEVVDPYCHVNNPEWITTDGEILEEIEVDATIVETAFIGGTVIELEEIEMEVSYE